MNLLPTPPLSDSANSNHQSGTPAGDGSVFPCYSEAAVGYIVGTEANPKCEYCARGSGRFEKCIIVTAPDGTAYFRGACCNCRYTAHPNLCSFYVVPTSGRWVPKGRKGKRRRGKGTGRGESEEADEESDGSEEGEEVGGDDGHEVVEGFSDAAVDLVGELKRQGGDYEAGPDSNGGYRWKNKWYPKGGLVFWPGMPEDLRRKHEQG
jgi:hypothetical protein